MCAPDSQIGPVLGIIVLYCGFAGFAGARSDGYTGNTVPVVDPDIEVLDLNYRRARLLRDHILVASRFGQKRAVAEGVRELVGVLDDTRGILREAINRFDENPTSTPEDMIDKLRIAVLIDGTAIELYMRDRPELTSDQERRLVEHAKKLTVDLGRYAKLIRTTVQSFWPEYWTDAIEAEFQAILKIKATK